MVTLHFATANHQTHHDLFYFVFGHNYICVYAPVNSSRFSPANLGTFHGGCAQLVTIEIERVSPTVVKTRLPRTQQRIERRPKLLMTVLRVAVLCNGVLVPHKWNIW
jgi:hypothetical protein